MVRVEPRKRKFYQAQYDIYARAVLVQLARCVFYAIYEDL